jgi:AcrR family transcriptional regulator
MRPKRGEAVLTAEQIKATARLQMAAQGAAGVSLRGIGRELGVTAPAIYNYFPRLDDLITALIVDAYSQLAGSLRAARQACAQQELEQQLLAVLLAYRAWAIEHPHEFALIFGTPVPGYHAPVERTRPAAQGVFAVILELLAQAYVRGMLHLPASQPGLPPGLTIALPASAPALPPAVLYTGLAGWYRIHGMILLELFGHTTSLINQPEQFYEYELLNLIEAFGMPRPATQESAQ